MTAKKVLIEKIEEYSKSLQSSGSVNNQLIVMTLDDDIEQINQLSDASAEALLFTIRQHEDRFENVIAPTNYTAFLTSVTEH
ncbi:hypothetical protein P4S73_29410 [Paraglaciecola sp. Hal342]|jgi:hypothetical protein|uniref:Uncharacterized protein n=1 Tax=Paraglaciecola chathamensis TaxID=368405 RepID=A0A8H9IE01_9ALTE|nr:hypothetical protein [Paraglaciecola oceanifecundans]GGZ77845.1 hypothetical protein GCM10011274_40020 [Paraglaciecola oceanifecundans]